MEKPLALVMRLVIGYRKRHYDRRLSYLNKRSHWLCVLLYICFYHFGFFQYRASRNLLHIGASFSDGSQIYFCLLCEPMFSDYATQLCEKSQDRSLTAACGFRKSIWHRCTQGVSL